MKKIYAFLLGVAVSGSALAQFAVGAQPMVKEKTTNFRTGAPAAVQGGEREVFYTNDFSDCAEWTTGNAFDDGLTQFYENLNFQCGTGIAPNPDGSAPIPTILSTTAANGFILVDSDGEANQAEIENCYIQMANPVDCSEHPFVSISFETQYRMWDGGSSDGNEFCWVEVSTDGTTWPDQSTTDDAAGRYELWPEMGTQDPVENPTLITFDITDIAGGAETVWLRFRWRGTYGYAWMVDDLTFFDTPANDMRADGYVSYTDEATSTVETGLGYYEYGAIPTSQITEFIFAGRVRNIGSNPQPNTVMEVAINGDVVGTSAADFTLEYGSFDTLRIEGYTPDATLGMYDITYTFMSDSLDENMSNNTATQSYEITDGSYGRDDATFSGVFPADGTVDYTAATPFQFFADATIYGVEVAIMDNSDAGTDLICHLLDFANLEIQESTEELVLLNPNTNGNDGTDGDVNWYYFPFEDPISVAAGEGWVAAFEHYGGSEVQIGESKNAPDQTAFVYGPFGTNQAYDWYFTNEVPMVRLRLDPNGEVAVNEVEGTNFSLGQNMPNPANGITRINYELNNADDVAFEVRDITGKLVQSMNLGTQAAGKNTIELNVEQFQAGIYTYTLTVGGERLTNRMIVK